jgi:hypothetical protein
MVKTKLTFDDKVIAAFAVYKYRSISKAARKLFLTPSCISTRISKLERELGFKLFDRTSGMQARCTDAGWKFFNTEDSRLYPPSKGGTF